MAAGALPALSATAMASRKVVAEMLLQRGLQPFLVLLLQQMLVRLRDPQLDAGRFARHELAVLGQPPRHAGQLELTQQLGPAEAIISVFF